MQLMLGDNSKTKISLWAIGKLSVKVIERRLECKESMKIVISIQENLTHRHHNVSIGSNNMDLIILKTDQFYSISFKN